MFTEFYCETNMAQEMVYNPLTDEEYAKLFSTLKCKSDESAVIANEVKKQLLNKFGSKPIDIMNIGAGVGWLEDDLIKHSDFKVNSVLSIEPNLEHAEKLREKSATWKDTVSDIDVSYFSAKFETAKKFDVIFLVHSIYYFDNVVEIIIKLKSFLKVDGIILIVIAGEKGGHELLPLIQQQMNIQPSTSNFSTDILSLGADLTKEAIKFQIGNRTVFHDVSDFIESKGAPNCCDTISFFLHTKYESLHKKLQDEIYDIVQKRVTVTKDSRYLFPEENTFITIENA